jgi:hypothetical protein
VRFCDDAPDVRERKKTKEHAGCDHVRFHRTDLANGKRASKVRCETARGWTSRAALSVREDSAVISDGGAYARHPQCCPERDLICREHRPA